jgi:hypothetical protein
VGGRAGPRPPGGARSGQGPSIGVSKERWPRGWQSSRRRSPRWPAPRTRRAASPRSPSTVRARPPSSDDERATDGSDGPGQCRRGPFDPSVRWFQHAVFYEVLIRGFYDSNNDGTGDLKGLREKLDYIEWLGIDCIWMLPFYPSPFRDSGYDISDFFNVHPDYGSIGDLVAFLEDAHSRGIRVIADLVMNHTSDQHPWFIESRSSRDNAKADWYVWNDDDQRWPDARVVFTDTERSNWTWDDTRQQYYWHRFFHHQPDLNYDNPEVADTMIDLVRFWLDLGFDGFRLDAVPYLYQRDGTAGGAPARDARLHQAHPQAVGGGLPRSHPPGRGQRLAERRGGLLRRRRRVPPVLPLPADAPPLHGGAAGAALPDHRDPGPDARSSTSRASGPSSCATTTS